MGQSLVKNYIHIVFSTKHRNPLITLEIENELYSYMGGICNDYECWPIKIGGCLDHVHILCHLSKKVPLATLLEKVKGGSSKWAKTKGQDYSNFYWQNGYAAFSVNPAQVDRVTDYIINQHRHHRKKTFKLEFIDYLKKYKVEYDERYVWD